MADQSLSFIESALEVRCKPIVSERSRACIEAKFVKARNTAERKGVEYWSSRREIQIKRVKHESSGSEVPSTGEVVSWTWVKNTNSS